ncbi:MAG: hypothetical protein EOP24_03600 [Hyphomicrobiales bacterium]|nr:MAG: hypothetical protein EOP24_03600 [Hyphomicrobiales bacterium]
MIRFRPFLYVVLFGFAATSAVAAQSIETGQLDGIVDEQMNYLQFRTALLGANWTPLVDPQCDGNVYGRPGGPKDDTNICRQLPELESCSGDGYCSMYFVHEPSGRKVQVVTYGDYTRWELRGGQSDLAVVEWSYQ